MSKKIIKDLSKATDEEFFVPDTSVIIEGKISELIKKDKIKGTVLIHNAVIAELEHQANMNLPTGMMGFEEVKKLRGLEQDYDISIEFEGDRPRASQIKYAKQGEIDAAIRDLAASKGGVLVTADKIQNEVALATGIKSMFVKFEKTAGNIKIEKFFDKTTMSIHLREDTSPKAKKGKPGEWEFVEVRKKKLTKKEVQNLSKDIIEKTKIDDNSFIEIEKRGSTIVQFRNYRIVMTRPPLSDGWEITAVRPVKILCLDDYNIDEKLYKRLRMKAEGILVAGAPGNGKSTFCQALANFYFENNKIVKTVEAPRDLILPSGITQYSKNKATHTEIHDILLLSRPDYTVFDEIRNTKDFMLFKDMRLSGVGMVGVVHATNPIDAIQRFIGRVELGMVPSIIDTVIYIEKGAIGKVLEISITVRVPSGMTEADLARPLVEVKNFMTGELVYEMYTFGEQTVVVPVKGMKSTSVARDLAKEAIKKKIEKQLPKRMNIEVKMPTENSIELLTDEKNIPLIIGKKGANIEKLEKSVGVSIQVKELKKSDKKNNNEGVDYDLQIGKRNIEILLDSALSGKSFDIYIGGEYFFTATASKRATIKITRKSEIGKRLVNAENAGKEIKLVL